MLYTRYNFGNPKTSHLPSSSAFSMCDSGVNGDFDTHAQSRRQDSGVKGSWLLYLGSNDCGRAEICDCDVCWPPRCHPGAFHLSQVSSIIISLCCPKNLTVVLHRLVRLRQESCSSCIGSNSVRLAILYILTQLPSLFSQWSRASSQRLFSCPSVPHRDSVSVLSVSGALWPDAEATHECIFVSNCHTRHGRLHIRQS